MIVLLDTNILASGLVAARGPLPLIFDAWNTGRFEVVVSAHILRELERTLANSYFSQKLSDDIRRDFLVIVRARARFVTPTVTVSGVATHPEDDLVLAAAVSAGADDLVTGDKHMRQLGNYAGVTILSPREFAAQL